MPSDIKKPISPLVIFGILLGFLYILSSNFSFNFTEPDTSPAFTADSKYAEIFSRKETNIPTLNISSLSFEGGKIENEERFAYTYVSSDIDPEDESEHSSNTISNRVLPSQIHALILKAKEELYFDPKKIKDRDSIKLSLTDSLTFHSPEIEKNGEKEDYPYLSDHNIEQNY